MSLYNGNLFFFENTGLFFIHRSNGDEYWTSSDAISWTKRITVGFSPGYITSTGDFVIAHVDNVFNPATYISSDGISWAYSSDRDISFYNGIYIGNARSGTLGVTWSRDAKTWVDTDIEAYYIVPMAGGVIGLGSSNLKHAYYSQDGIEWSRSAIPRFLFPNPIIDSPYEPIKLGDNYYFIQYGFYQSQASELSYEFEGASFHIAGSAYGSGDLLQSNDLESWKKVDFGNFSTLTFNDIDFSIPIENEPLFLKRGRFSIEGE